MSCKKGENPNYYLSEIADLEKENKKLKRLVELWRDRHLVLNELYNLEHGIDEDYIKKVCGR